MPFHKQPMLTAPELEAAVGVRHGFFTREGGVSEGVYASLNCGLGSHDDPERVAENRARALGRLGLAADALVTVHQVHSAEAAVADKPWLPESRPRADAIVTSRHGLALGILTADCAPVLFADPAHGVIGAAHAGWRGAKNGILEATVRAMRNLGARVEDTAACIGPCIQQPSYEVGPEFRDAFLADDAGDGDLFVAAPRPRHFLFDLAGYVVRRLSRLGVKTVGRIVHDTFADERRFYSYRRAIKRGEADYGRLLSAVALTG